MVKGHTQDVDSLIRADYYEAGLMHNAEREYDHLVQMLDTLIDIAGEDEIHPFEKYEDEHIPEITAS